MPRPILHIAALALATITGIVAMLLVEGAWDWLFLAFAAMPLLFGGAMVLRRRRRAQAEIPSTAK